MILGKSDKKRHHHLQRNKNKKRTPTEFSYLRVAARAHAYRRTIERRAADSMKAKMTITKKKTREEGRRQDDIDTPEDISLHHLWLINYGERTRKSTLALGYPLLGPFGHSTTCRSPALTFTAAINFAMKRSTPCSDALRHSPSFWAALVQWSALILKASSEVVQGTPHPLFFLRPPPIFGT